MRALKLENYNQLSLIDADKPTLRADEVLIDVVATGICGSDLHGYTGENQRRFPGQIMGHESVGRIVELGSEVTGFSVGQPATFNPVVLSDPDHATTYESREQHCPSKVILGVTPEESGAFAQQIAVPAENIVTLPESMPIQYGALIEPLAVAVHAVRRAQVQPSDSVLVLGGGPIGQSVVLALKMLGVEMIAVTEMVKQRRDVVSELGALPLDASDSDLPERVHSIFDGPADAAIDTVGINATLSLALASTKVGAVVCLAGMGALSLTFDASQISVSERTITGTFTYTAQDFRDAAAWMGTAPDHVSLMISRQISPEQAPDEFHRLAHGGESSGKVLVMFGSETGSSTACSQSKKIKDWST